ncbi:MAG: trigger factor, partial [Polymorphobacter sp.]
MRIAETMNEGLKRAYSVSIPASELAARVDKQLATVAKQIRMPGFRPGKVPHNLVRKMHGAQLRSDALNEVVQESMNKLMADHALRPATQPQVDLAAMPDEGQDVDFNVTLEVLPTIEAPHIEGITLEKLIVEPGDAEMTAALTRLADQQKSFEPAPAKHKAATGDAVVMDYEGRVDGEIFDGGKGEGMRVTLGSGQLIPGFEDQLAGVKTGDQRTVSVTFPADYNVAYLKGKPAEFAVTVTAVETPKAVVIDDSLATGFGIESLDALKEILKDQVEAELGQLTRTHMKRKLLDNLASSHDFAVPESMVEAEFGQIWQQIEAEAEGLDADEKAKLEADRGEYRRIAERRVRLGLLLSEIGQANGVQVTQAEMNRLIGQEANKYPGEQQKVVKYFQDTPMAAAQLRAPLYEDKVVDFLLSKAALVERIVTREALVAEIENEDETPGHVHGPDCDHGHDHDEKPAKKPAKAKAVKAAVAAEAPAAAPAEVAAKPAKAKPAARKPAAAAAAEAAP